MTSLEKTIDLSKLLKQSPSPLLRRMPGFVVYFLKLLIREKEINYVLNKYANDVGNEFVRKMVEEFNITIEYEGLENLPENGKCFFVANHPYGFMDGIVLTYTVINKYGRFRAIGNELFRLIPQVRPLVAAVNVFGSNPKDYILELEKLFESDMPITHFPAGLVSRIHNGKVMDRDWQKSFIKKAIDHQRDIVPFYFPGRNSRLFYRIYKLRKFFGITTNLELSLLPHEIFNKKHRIIKVKIGKPISWQTFDQSKTHHEWAQWVKEQVYSL